MLFFAPLQEELPSQLALQHVRDHVIAIISGEVSFTINDRVQCNRVAILFRQFVHRADTLRTEVLVNGLIGGRKDCVSTVCSQHVNQTEVTPLTGCLLENLDILRKLLTILEIVRSIFSDCCIVVLHTRVVRTAHYADLNHCEEEQDHSP